MSRNLPVYLSLMLLVVLLSGCELIGDLLAFGFWTGVVVVAVIVLIVWAISRRLRRRPRT